MAQQNHGSSEEIQLERLSPKSRPDVPTSSPSEAGVEDRSEGIETQSPPEDAVSDSRPTRRYQTLLVVGGFLMIAQIFGINSIYGIFQEFYTSSETNIKDAQGQDALVALVGTLAYGLTWGGGILVNPLMIRVKNLKLISLSGAFIASLGLFLASFSTRLWHLFLTQALLYGIGSTLVYFPLMSNAPRFFDRHRGFAMAVILSGNGVGGLVLAPVVHSLIDRLGVQWTLRILGLWTLVILTPVAFVPRQLPGFEARRRGKLDATRLNMALVKRGTFLAQAVGCFVQTAGYIVPPFYLTTFSTSVLDYSTSTGSLFLALYNAINTIARIVMGILADRIGRQNMLVISVLLSSLSVFALWYDASRARFIAFVVLYGIVGGGYNALIPTTISEVYGVQNYDAVNGSLYFLRGLGAVIGPPTAGAILGSHRRGSPGAGMGYTISGLDALKKRYNDMVVYDGMLLAGACVCVMCVRWYDAKEKGMWRWKA